MKLIPNPETDHFVVSRPAVNGMFGFFVGSVFSQYVNTAALPIQRRAMMGGVKGKGEEKEQRACKNECQVL